VFIFSYNYPAIIFIKFNNLTFSKWNVYKKYIIIWKFRLKKMKISNLFFENFNYIFWFFWIKNISKIKKLMKNFLKDSIKFLKVLAFKKI
jgi:hypothetical protein